MQAVTFSAAVPAAAWARLTALAIALFLVAVPLDGAAQSLGDARAAGIFGETRGGYIALVDRTAPAAYKALMDRINTARRKDFAKLASQNGISVDQAGRIAAERIIGGLPAGAVYEGAGGGWKRK